MDRTSLCSIGAEVPRSLAIAARLVATVASLREVAGGFRTQLDRRLVRTCTAKKGAWPCVCIP